MDLFFGPLLKFDQPSIQKSIQTWYTAYSQQVRIYCCKLTHQLFEATQQQTAFDRALLEEIELFGGICCEIEEAGRATNGWSRPLGSRC